MAAMRTTDECDVTAGIESILLLCAGDNPRAIPTFRIVAGTGYALPRAAQPFRLRHIIYTIRRRFYVTVGRRIVFYPARRKLLLIFADL